MLQLFILGYSRVYYVTAVYTVLQPRLRCLINIFKMMDSENRDFLVAVLPEAILCTREIGEAARKNAYDLLVTMCEANIGWHPDGELNSGLFYTPLTYFLF